MGVSVHTNKPLRLPGGEQTQDFSIEFSSKHAGVLSWCEDQRDGRTLHYECLFSSWLETDVLIAPGYSGPPSLVEVSVGIQRV